MTLAVADGCRRPRSTQRRGPARPRGWASTTAGKVLYQYGRAARGGTVALPKTEPAGLGQTCQGGPLLGLLILVISIAIGDSLNPSTVAPALYLATTEHPVRQVGGFTLGVFAVNLLAGLLIMIGPGQWLLSLIPRPSAATKHIIELIAGTIILTIAAGLWLRRRSFARSKLPSVKTKGGSGLALGAGIGAIELPTALPYFAAIAAITASGFSVSVRVGMLVIYNVVFVLPLVAILVAVEVLGEDASRILGVANQRLEQHWPVLIAGLGLIIGTVILALGIVGLATALI